MQVFRYELDNGATEFSWNVGDCELSVEIDNDGRAYFHIANTEKGGSQIIDLPLVPNEVG